MGVTVAIHPDDYTNPSKPPGYDAASPRWSELLQKAGHQVKWVDVRRPDILDQLHGCQGFMWRWAHFNGMSRIARRLLPVIERNLGLVVYPDQNTCWHYDDKIAQAYLLQAMHIPTPRTWIWFDRAAAKQWAAKANYPLVLKLTTGAASSNVKLIAGPQEAERSIDRLFSRRLTSLDKAWLRRTASMVRRRLRNLPRDDGYEVQVGYVLFQEFLPDNRYDTRVTVIGNRAFAFRRFNRDNDFRASGSGKIDRNPQQVDLEFVKLAFRTAEAISSQSCAIDGLYRGKECVVGEISYTYVCGAIQECSGHWELDGDSKTGNLQWVPGNMWPEEAQIQDFNKRLALKHVGL